MSKIFYISDSHHHHKNILSIVPRPQFDNINHMNKYMISKWNEVVTNDDTIIHLGDFSFGPREVQKDIYNQLNGKKILVRGNHDGSIKRMKDIGFQTVVNSLSLLDNKQQIFCIHDPNKITDKMLEQYKYILHGHLHLKQFKPKEGLLIPEGKCFNVCVEKLNYTPKTLNEIIL